VSLAAITLCVASQRVFVVVYFVIDLVGKLLDTPSYMYRRAIKNFVNLPESVSQPRPDLLQRPTSLLSYGYQGLLPCE
jgi:hypothetical protein